MAKTKPISPEKKESTEARIAKLENMTINVYNLLALYVDYNKDGKGFQRFIEERVTARKEQKPENEKD